MLLNNRPARAPLTHLERVRFMPSYDPNPSIRLRPPVNVVNLHSAPSDVDPTATLASVPTPAQVASLYDLHRPQSPSPLRQVTNAPEQPPLKLQHRLTIANLGTPGGKLVGFPHRCKQNLSVPKRVRFRGAEIIIPPVPTFPTSPATPLENIPAEAQQPSDRSDVAPLSVVPDENTFLNPSVHARTVSDHETSATADVDEFPDSPSVYSPTPPNSSVPSANHLSESSRGPPIIDTGYLRPSFEQFLGEGTSNKQHTGELSISEQPCGEDRSTSTSEDDSRGVTKEHASNRHRGNSADALSWWGRAAITFSVAKTWEKKAYATAAREPGETKKIDSSHQGETE